MDIAVNRILLACLAALAAACFPATALAAGGAGEEKNTLSLSGMRVEIASQGRTATFRLYDTDAAREFYEQLPLSLDLSNFRDAQWMFYPPKKLNVKPEEAYHDGKKGELSYYAPWGDAFMLYEDFYAGDEMHRLGVGLSGIDDIEAMSGTAVIRKMNPTDQKDEKTMRITVKANGKTIVFELNDSQASKDLYAQLPLDIDVENYSSNEKIYYPPKKLGTSNTPLVKAAKPGTLAYYAPWGDVVMFFGTFGSASGLYELGKAVQGGDQIPSLSGTLRIEAE
ncbi:hypothetical protein BerOc1_02060 [Pseudodesulfovibrio hydrargyri]|uniref:Cyclophilin-like domain-containing protein n=1 Tax=Pseudodesulfovibrio hydrargyri TaxID=2125990 RepID=A0A1J5MVY1_9BACT|nr:cyclophilin-like fold protein [Pseudodesulfovibrio hydrargyri]OIQ50130.1 hypothetical protein BerOc1_02060 [Pseudodesulfovibrio hydrargyri]